jgi:hypothetical protein
LNWNFLFLSLKKIGHTTKRKWKKPILKFEQKLAIPLVENEIYHGNLKWKFWNFSFLKWKIPFEIWKNGHFTRGKWKKLKWRNHIFRLCHRDKTSNNTPVPPIPPMYTTLYHRCKLWWYTINLNCWILFPTVV